MFALLDDGHPPDTRPACLCMPGFFVLGLSRREVKEIIYLEIKLV